MEAKDFIGLTLIPLAMLAGIVIACVSEKARAAAFFLMITGCVVIDRFDINFVSRYWYRGTTRGFEYSLIDILAVSVLFGALFAARGRQSRWFWPAGFAPMIGYFLYCCASIAFSEPKLFGMFEASKILRAFIVFLAAAMYVRSDNEVKILIVALICTACFEGMMAMRQRFLQGEFRVGGSLEHPNSLSMYLCLIAPVLVAAAASSLPRYIRFGAYAGIAACALGILLTISRAGMPIFALVTMGAALACITWRITTEKIIITLCLCIGFAGVAYRTWDILKARYGEATLEQEYMDEQNEGRGLYIRFARAIVADHSFGVGLNNWSYWVSKRYGPDLGWKYEDYDDLDYMPNKEILPSFHYAAPAHNLGALTAGELGLPGLLLFGFVWLRWFHMGARFVWRRSPELVRLAGAGIFFGTCGIFLQSLTEWTYRQTPILFTFHILLGTLASLVFIQRQQRRRLADHNSEALAHQQAWVHPAGALARKA